MSRDHKRLPILYTLYTPRPLFFNVKKEAFFDQNQKAFDLSTLSREEKTNLFHLCYGAVSYRHLPVVRRLFPEQEIPRWKEGGDESIQSLWFCSEIPDEEISADYILQALAIKRGFHFPTHWPMNPALAFREEDLEEIREALHTAFAWTVMRPFLITLLFTWLTFTNQGWETIHALIWETIDDETKTLLKAHIS